MEKQRSKFMNNFFINGGHRLCGKYKVSTSKNATLPILAASILNDQKVVIKQVPHFSDVEIMLQILTNIGCKVTKQNGCVIIDASNLTNFEPSYELTKQVRASIFLLGPILVKFKHAKFGYPGGCDIGTRPIDLHLMGLRKMGAKNYEEHGYMYCNGEEMRGAIIPLSFPSVGATENLMMAASIVRGKTQILNAALEPEIVDLANFINACGGKVSGAGTSTITIEGVKKLNTPVEYTPIGDRIIAGTYFIAGAMTGGKIELSNVNKEHIYDLIDKLKNSACNIEHKFGKITLESDGKYRALGLVNTQPYPGFPTDLQAPLMAMQTIADGVSVLTENVFESRFKQVPELIRMGANITVKDKMAIIKGEQNLFGAEVVASDLRAGASLVLSGLVAKGYTTIHEVHHIDRGYEQMELALASLGADIKRI
jgi:UDP-N-acetylglucosamine 1-carboxyvinyltransferase